MHCKEYLVVQEVDYPGGPFSARDDGRISSEQSQQTQSSRLFHYIQSVSEKMIECCMDGTISRAHSRWTFINDVKGPVYLTPHSGFHI